MNWTSKYYVLIGLCPSWLWAQSLPPIPPPRALPPPVVALDTTHPTGFMTTVQFAVIERTPQLTKRSEKLVMENFAEVFESWPEFQGQRYDVKSREGELVFYVAAPNDLRQPMARAVTHLIKNLNGHVRARGRTQFYRTSLGQPGGGFLEVRSNDQHTHILSVSAQSVPLRDVLKEIKAQIGGLSYLIPGDCADQVVDWSFGEEGTEEPKTLDGAMHEISSLFRLGLERHNNTYVFSGECQSPEYNARRALGEPIEERFWGGEPPGTLPRPTSVVFPVAPIPR